jgi:dolichol-phosphate mannosyltransferase
MLPTYNEAANIGPLIAAIHRAVPEAVVVVVDDDSPDGTWKIVEALAARDGRVRLMHRTEKRGRGYAGAAGFRFCLERGFDPIVEMDADFSHDPAHLPELIAASREADVVIGSRGVAGGGESGRGLLRRLITSGARLYLRWMLGVREVKDPTSGYRCFTREALRRIDPYTLAAPGPAIVSEVLFRCRALRIREVPIRFRNRAEGESKFGLRAILESLLTALKLRLRG